MSTLSPRLLNRRAAFAAIGLIVILVLLQQALVLPGSTQLDRALKNALHTPLFFVLTLLIWYLLRRFAQCSIRKYLLLCLVAGLSLALLTEALQFFTPRDADPDDVVLDLLGTGSALFAILAFQTTPLRKLALLVLAAVTFSAGFSQVFYTLVLYQQREALRPVLVDFDRTNSLILNNIRGEWSLAQAPGGWPTNAGEQVAAVRLEASRRYPGLRFAEPWPDWNPYQWLVVDYYLNSVAPLDNGAPINNGAPLPLTVRVETERDRGMETAVEVLVETGPGVLRIPVRELIARSAPDPAETDTRADHAADGAAADLPLVRNLLIFTTSMDDQAGRELFVGEIRLAR